MTPGTRTSAAWPLLVARLRHLLVAEGFGHTRHRYPGDIPVAARARTGRHLVALGPGSVARLCGEWPGIERLAIWPDLRRLMLSGGEPAPGSALLAPGFDEPLLDPRNGDPRTVTRQLVRRLAYLCAEEFDDGPIGLLTLSRAWLDLRAVRAREAHLLEAYLDSTDTIERRVIRFCLRNLGLFETWESSSDADLFRALADRMDRYPLTMAEATPGQIERFRRAGMLSESFGRSPSAVRTNMSDYTLAGGRFVSDRPFPGSRGDSLDIGIDCERGEPVLITKLFVADDEALPQEAGLALRHDGISTLLQLARIELPGGMANVMVEALPRAIRSDEHLPLAPGQALALADRVAAILETVHATGHCVVGLRPELTFVDARGEPILVPRGDALRRLTWPEGPKVEGQEPPFRDLYLAPELLTGGSASSASDVFSLCAMLVYWIQSSHPFARDSVAAQLQAMLSESPDVRGLPGSTSGIVARGLSPVSERRPTLAELRRAFGA